MKTEGHSTRVRAPALEACWALQVYTRDWFFLVNMGGKCAAPNLEREEQGSGTTRKRADNRRSKWQRGRSCSSLFEEAPAPKFHDSLLRLSLA